MRKRFAIAFIGAMVAGLFAAAVPAQASHTPSEQCGGDVVATGTDGENSASVCIEGVGAATASQQGENGGYIVADGDPGNAPSEANHCLDGYIGVQVVDGQPEPVASGGTSAGGDSDSYHYPDSSEGDPDPAACG